MRVVEHFYSLQGEGTRIGVPTYFVRVAGCSLRCAWCDTKFSLDPGGGEEMSLDRIMRLIGGCEDVCLTGGEPLEQADSIDLLRMLAEAGKTVVLETNGAADVSAVPDDPHIIISMDIKCPSSGMQDRMLLSNLDRLGGKDQLKFVIADRRDLDYAEAFLAEHAVGANAIFSPVGGTGLREIADEVVARRLGVRVLPQLHKLIWGDRKGVRPGRPTAGRWGGETFAAASPSTARRAELPARGTVARARGSSGEPLLELKPSLEVVEALLHGAVVVVRDPDPGVLKDLKAVRADAPDDAGIDLEGHDRLGDLVTGALPVRELVLHDLVVVGVAVDDQEIRRVAEVLPDQGIEGVPLGNHPYPHQPFPC